MGSTLIRAIGNASYPEKYSIKTSFSSARLAGDKGVCENRQKNNWQAEVFVNSKRGIGIDRKVLKEHADKILSGLDRKIINKIPPFDKTSPSSEEIATLWLLRELAARVNPNKYLVWKAITTCLAK